MPIPSFSDIVKVLNTALNQTAAVEVQAFIFDLQNKLYELKEQNLSLKTELQEKNFQHQSQIMELQRTLDRQQKDIDSVSNWEKITSKYQFDSVQGIWIHTSTKNPFCPKCFADKRETPLQVRDFGAGNVNYFCAPCNQGF